MISGAHDATGKEQKTCFSYIRFSHRKQAKGSSEDRQHEIAPRVAREKGWHLDDSLSIADLGLSAWKKTNLGPKGKLGAVKEALRNGTIPVGTIMICEALDRLTRAELDEAYDLFRDLLRAGLEIYIDKGGRLYTRASLKNPIDLLIAIVELNAANDYSAKLSDRVLKGWNKARERVTNGQKLTKKVPGWIDAKTWKPVPERAAIVKRVFKLYDEGKGISAIVRLFNEENIPTWGRGVWNSSYLSMLLHSRAVIGEFQQHRTEPAKTGDYYKRIKIGAPIANYFPSIIAPELFYRVQAKLGDNEKAPRTDTIINLFSGLAHCTCGSKMYLASSRKGKYYMCWSKVKGLGCSAPSTRYEPLEQGLVKFFSAFPEQLLHKDTKNDSEATVLRGEIEALEKQIANITDFVLKGAATNALVEKQAQLEKDVDSLKKKLEVAHAKTVRGTTDIRQLEHIKANIQKLGEDVDFRRRIRDWLIANVSRLECDTNKGDFTMTFNSGGVELRYLLNFPD